MNATAMHALSNASFVYLIPAIAQDARNAKAAAVTSICQLFIMGSFGDDARLPFAAVCGVFVVFDLDEEF